jgi:hypothetical protein
MSSVRQNVIDAAIARIKLINGTGGYTTNLGSRVEDSRTNWDQNELPAVSVFDSDAIVPDPEAFDKRPHVIQTMRLLFRGFVAQGTDAATVRTLAADIWTAIRQDTQWTVGATKLVMQSRHIRDAVVRNIDSFEVEACEVEIEVQFVTPKFSATAA